MEGEIAKFLYLWFQIALLSCYCYLVAKIIPKGITRLISILPIMCLFLLLPLNLHSFHFGIITCYYISWLANFKLLTFAFGIGPLSSQSLTFIQFILLLCFPIKFKEIPPKKSSKQLVEKTQTKKGNSLYNGEVSNIGFKGGLKSFSNYATKAFLSIILLFIAEHQRDSLPLYVFHFFMGIYVYMGSEILVDTTGFVCQLLLRTPLESRFGEPYLSSSLKDFWGWQWNQESSSSLRLTIYKPILRLSTPILGPQWALIPSVMGTFLVSAFMHELMFYQVGRLRPTSGTILYFELNGLFLLIEGILRSLTGPWRLPRIISGIFIFGLEIMTFVWMVMPSLLRWDVVGKAMEEYEAAGNFLIDLFWDLGELYRPPYFKNVRSRF